MTESFHPDWRIERYAVHDVKSFDCGKPLENAWLHRRVGAYEKRGLARCYVAVRRDGVVCGYYALSSHRVVYNAKPRPEPRRLARVDISVARLLWLAVDMQSQRRGLGSRLLLDALRRAEHLATPLGVQAVEADAADDQARNFYLKHGFTSLEDDREHLFLPMRVIRQLNLPPLSPAK